MTYPGNKVHLKVMRLAVYVKITACDINKVNLLPKNIKIPGQYPISWKRLHKDKQCTHGAVSIRIVASYEPRARITQSLIKSSNKAGQKMKRDAEKERRAP